MQAPAGGCMWAGTPCLRVGVCVCVVAYMGRHCPLAMCAWPLGACWAAGCARRAGRCSLAEGRWQGMREQARALLWGRAALRVCVRRQACVPPACCLPAYVRAPRLHGPSVLGGGVMPAAGILALLLKAPISLGFFQFQWHGDGSRFTLQCAGSAQL